MSIQIAEGPITLDSSDWQRSHAGVAFGVKIRAFPMIGATGAFIVEQIGGAWAVVENLDDDLTEQKIINAGGVDGWIARAVQRLNAWMATRFAQAPHAIAVPVPATSGDIVEQVDRALPAAIRLDASISWQNVKRIAVIGDSISTRNSGASSVAWPALLGSMIRDGGVHDIEVRNYSLPGLTWKTAHIPTPGWLIAGKRSPVEALRRDGCDVLIICLGVNDRQNAHAQADALALKAALAGIPVVYVRQHLHDPECPNATAVTAQEQTAIDAVYAALAWEGPAGVALAKLYACGMSYDKLHPTNSGKQWIANAIYMWLQGRMPITPIARNVAWLWATRTANQEQYTQIINAQR